MRDMCDMCDMRDCEINQLLGVSQKLCQLLACSNPGPRDSNCLNPTNLCYSPKSMLQRLERSQMSVLQ